MGARIGLRTAAVAAVGVIGAIAVAGAPYSRAASFVARAAALSGWPATAAAWTAEPVATRLVTVPTRQGSIRAKLYLPRSARRAALLVPGIHPAGIDEPRLVDLAANLASSGIAVLTPEVPDLMRFQITTRVTDTIEDTATWFADYRDDAHDGRIGLMGISFSGGLSVVAAGRPSLKNRTAYVFTLGGHGDLGRVLRFLCTGIAPDGSKRRPHDYGLAVVLASLAHRVVPADQADRLVAGIHTFLLASSLDAVRDPDASRYFDEARTLARTLPEPAAGLLTLVNDRDVERLGPRLIDHVSALSTEPALSPERVEPPQAPVFLLHGTDDVVVPAAESVLLGQYLERRGTRTHVLLSRLITHAEIERPPETSEAWELIVFWKDLLGQ